MGWDYTLCLTGITLHLKTIAATTGKGAWFVNTQLPAWTIRLGAFIQICNIQKEYIQSILISFNNILVLYCVTILTTLNSFSVIMRACFTHMHPIINMIPPQLTPFAERSMPAGQWHSAPHGWSTQAWLQPPSASEHFLPEAREEWGLVKRDEY